MGCACFPPFQNNGRVARSGHTFFDNFGTAKVCGRPGVAELQNVTVRNFVPLDVSTTATE